ncbi:MAG: pentapeptide repeat-containing protein [Desulfofustis sp.]
MKTCIAAWLACLLITIAGCGPVTKRQAVSLDNIQLTGEELIRAVSDKSLILTAYDFSGTIYFQADGQLSGVDNLDQRDIGRWKISDNQELCLKFRLWYYGDSKCYTVFNNPQADRLTFFTSNGAAYYTAMSIAGDPAALAKYIEAPSTEKSARTQSLSEKDRQSPGDGNSKTAEEPRRIVISASQESDSGQTVKRLAGNCPGCNMAGINLSEASLIKANLQGADLEGADLRYANLRRADLSGADLKNARLNHANLPGADLSGADLSGADLSGANLLLANFTGANVSGALFTNANLEKTIGLPDIP